MTIETIQKDNDTLYRFIFQEKAMRGEWVRLNDTFAECLHHHNYPTVVRNLLGEMLVATSLLTATLKFDGDITFQIQGDGPVRLALVNGNNSQQMRALAELSDDVNEDMTLHQLVGKAVLVISITPKQGERYQGVVALDKPTISECIQDYFERSEQLPSNLVIRIGEWQGKPVAAGLLLQVLPSEEHNKEDLNHLHILAETVKNEELFELPAEELLYRLYHEETVEIFEPSPTSFFCGCSQERSGSALLLLSEEELEQALAEHNGTIDMQCECCGTHYLFNKAAIDELKS